MFYRHLYLRNQFYALAHTLTCNKFYRLLRICIHNRKTFLKLYGNLLLDIKATEKQE
uniref:Uncharacterized protein n=1 Tax=Heterorhabditis bacteriophora TaxID=37862 RepID=A0A1I7WRC4_HETBA